MSQSTLHLQFKVLSYSKGQIDLFQALFRWANEYPCLYHILPFCEEGSMLHLHIT